MCAEFLRQATGAPPALAWRLALALAIAGPLCAAVDAAGQASQNVSAAARPGAEASSASAPPARPLQPADAPATSLAERDRLTGNWGGARDDLAGRGVTFQLELTGFFQSALAGAPAREATAGRVDALVTLDGGKLGLWSGFGFNVHVESVVGDIPVFRGGALWPGSAGTALPLDKRGEVVATSLYFTQRLGASGSLLIGKINAVDLLARDPFFGGWGIHRFQNLAFVAPPSGLVPPVIMGAVLVAAKAPWSYTFMVYDPGDRTSRYWVDDLFRTGVNAQGGATWTGAVGGRATSLGLTATMSTTDKIDLGAILLPPELQGETKKGSWGVAVQAGHLLAESPVQKGKGLGIYGKAALSDGNPNVIRASFSGGLAAHGTFEARPYDSFGVGLYWYNFSNDLQSTVSPLVGFNDELGVEMFYSAAITRWLRAGANVQVVNPARATDDVVVVGGVRVNIVF
jgi:porin